MSRWRTASGIRSTSDWDDPQTKGGNSASYLIYDYFLQGNIVNSQRVKGSYSYPALASSDYAA